MVADWQAVLATPAGERVIGNLLVATGFYGTLFGGADTHYTAFNEGKRSIGEFIVRQVGAAAPQKLTPILMGGLNDEHGTDSNQHNTRNAGEYGNE